MTDASCGWCVTACLSRNASPGSCQDGIGNLRNITLNVTECTLCSDHVDCQSCVQVGIQKTNVVRCICSAVEKRELYDGNFLMFETACANLKYFSLFRLSALITLIWFLEIRF